MTENNSLGPRPKPIVRRAAPSDAERLAHFIYLAGPEVYRNLLGRDAKPVLPLLQEICRREGHLFSFDNAFVAEHDGHVIGAAVSFHKRDERRQGWRYVRFLRRALPGRAFLAVCAHLALMRRMVRPIDEAGLFLSSLAVQPEAQGAGVGAALLAGVFDKARRLGLAHVECDVETDNEGALRFYRRFGFRPVGERRAGIFRSRLGFAGYVRIRCELAPAGPAGGPAKGG